MLNNAERGVYSTICNLIYSHGGPVRIETTDAAAARVFGCGALELITILKRLRITDKIHQNRDKKTTVRRCEEVILGAQKVILMRRSSGALGGRPSKQNNDLQKPNGFAGGKLTTNQEPRTKNQEPDSLRELRARNEAFAEWWREFPNKVGKAAAFKSYNRALARASPAELIVGLHHYVAVKPPDREWCNPATWLNQDRWLDEPEFPTRNGHGPIKPSAEQVRHERRAGLVAAVARRMEAGERSGDGFDC